MKNIIIILAIISPLFVLAQNDSIALYKYVEGKKVYIKGGVINIGGNGTIADGSITSSKLANAIDVTKLADGSVSNTEFQYLDGVTSNIQTQLDNAGIDSSPIVDNGSGRYSLNGPLSLGNTNYNGAALDMRNSSNTGIIIDGRTIEAFNNGTNGGIDINSELYMSKALTFNSNNFIQNANWINPDLKFRAVGDADGKIIFRGGDTKELIIGSGDVTYDGVSVLGLSGENAYMNLASGDITASDNNFINSLDTNARNNNIVNGATSVTFGSGITTTRGANFDGTEGGADFDLIPDTGYTFSGVGIKNGARAYIQSGEKLKCTATDRTTINLGTISGTEYKVESTCEIISQ